MVVTGGSFREIGWYCVDWVSIYLCGKRRWVEGPALQKSRRSHCSVGVGDRLYVMGGTMDEGLVADVEVSNFFKSIILGILVWSYYYYRTV